MTLDPKAVDAVYEQMRAKLHDVVPDAELRLKAPLVVEIEELKRKRNAVILGHNYMEPALYHTVPDFKGDSLELARRAAETTADVIVFCGVRFMAETAKILNPARRVLLPTPKGGCSLAESITGADVRALRERYPGVPVVCYINTSAEVKAECDVCCTSGNASAIVRALGPGPVILVPDEFLAGNVARETGREIIFPVRGPRAEGGKLPQLAYEIVGWQGRCEVHEKFTVDDIRAVRKQFPDVVILAHPECSPEVVEASDFSASTSAMIRYVEESDAPHYLLLTECSMGDNIAAANPDKDMLRLCAVRCPHMNEITLEDTLDALVHDRWKIELPEDVRRRAARSLERMIAIG
jgi:quinolinate synthase